ncbi:phage holin family protein [Sphingomonas qomolangmaensis]|uniref:Phage holin family protein n=1 Tax=Sphingomonas qomolangmaensis TaxID=2918765 RepID=A0ABY5LAM5_9SPHN|nr:phage holin family protein [Sphingomonas qomolangmaensis]UUL82784.1 phage holin family protein [Sphingomonas qomolangmaensis]
MLFFMIGFVVLAVAGRPAARKLAAEGRDTVANGILLGAAAGSLTGTVVAVLVATLLLGSPRAALSLVMPLFGLVGVLNGAVAGLAFIWLGRKGSTRRDPADAGKHVDFVVEKRFRWFWAVIFLGLGLPIAALIQVATYTSPKPVSFPIGGVVYEWPDGTTVSPPEHPRYYGKGYVSYRSSNRYRDPDSFSIIYDGNNQSALNRVGLPHLRMVTFEDRKPEDYLVRTTSAGRVICNRQSIKAGFAHSCGMSFVHRRARWQLRFNVRHARNAERLHREARARLEAFRYRPKR